jgi:uncharacterized RDD family membrane protein YckC
VRVAAGIVDGALVALVVTLVPWIGWLLGALYLLLRDGIGAPLAERRSLGKHLLDLRVVRTDGEPMDIPTSLSRNVSLAAGPLVLVLPFLYVWVLGLVIPLVVVLIEVSRLFVDPEGRRLGDKLAGTRVVKADF